MFILVQKSLIYNFIILILIKFTVTIFYNKLERLRLSARALKSSINPYS